MSPNLEGTAMPGNVHEIRAAVVARYGRLAEAAAAGGQVTDCAPDAFTEGGFGAAANDDTSGLPDAAVRASLGCGNPVAVAGLRSGETVLDLGSGAASTCCCLPAGSVPAGKRTDWTPPRQWSGWPARTPPGRAR